MGSLFSYTQDFTILCDDADGDGRDGGDDGVCFAGPGLLRWPR